MPQKQPPPSDPPGFPKALEPLVPLARVRRRGATEAGSGGREAGVDGGVGGLAKSRARRTRPTVGYGRMRAALWRPSQVGHRYERNEDASNNGVSLVLPRGFGRVARRSCPPTLRVLILVLVVLVSPEQAALGVLGEEVVRPCGNGPLEGARKEIFKDKP